MGDLDDFGELYADLDDRVSVGVLTAATEEEDKNEMEAERVGFENGDMECGSSSDSDDDLRIVLNEEDSYNKFPAQLLAERMDCEDDGDGLVNLTGLDCSGKEPKMIEQLHSADGLLLGNVDRPNAMKGAHRNWLRPCLAGSAVRPRNSLSRRSHFEHLTVPCSLGKALHNSVFPSTLPNGYDFYLPQSRSIFNIDVESFEYKPWRFNGVDITDYFNFGLDEEGWRTYCKQLAHFQQNNLPLHESAKLSKSTSIMSGEIAQYGCKNSDYLDNGRKGIKMPKGQAIHVECGNGDRLPSMDIRRPRNQDSDVVIQITTGSAVEDPIIKRLNHMDDNRSKNEILLNSKNILRKSSLNVDTCAFNFEESSIFGDHPSPYIKKPLEKKLDQVNCDRDCPLSITLLSKPVVTIGDHYSSGSKSSDHNDSVEASMDEAKFEQVPRPECIHLKSDSLLQESFLPCYPSSEPGDDTNKTVRTSCGGRSLEPFLDLNYCQQATPCKVVQLSLSSEDDGAFPPVHEQKIDGEPHTRESGTVVKQWAVEPVEMVHSIQESKIFPKNNIKHSNGKNVNAAAFSARSKGNDEDPPLVQIREKLTTVKEVNMSKNGCYNNQWTPCSRAHEIFNWDSLQSTSPNMSLHDKMVFFKRSVDGHGTAMRFHYNFTEAKDRHKEIALAEFSERSLDKNFGRCVSYLYEEEGSLCDKYDRVPCGAGAFRRLPELDNPDKTLKRSSEFVYDHEDPRFYEERLHSRIYREANAEDKSSGHEDGFHKQHLSTLLCHSGHSHTRETFSQQHSKHDIFISKKSHHFSRPGFNLDADQLPAEVRKAYPYNNAYNESRKSRLALPWLLAKEKASFRRQCSKNLSSSKRHTYNSIHLQSGRIDKWSFSQQKVYNNHLHNSNGNMFTVRSEDFDSGGRVGSPSDKFIKDRTKLDNLGYRQAVTEHLNGLKVKTIPSAQGFTSIPDDFPPKQASGSGEGPSIIPKEIESMCHSKKPRLEKRRKDKDVLMRNSIDKLIEVFSASPPAASAVFNIDNFLVVLDSLLEVVVDSTFYFKYVQLLEDPTHRQIFMRLRLEPCVEYLRASIEK